MSRAFVKEDDAAGADMPDRPIPPHRNLVTARGLARIEVEVASLREAMTRATAAADRALVAALSRDALYWTARLASAEVSTPAPDDTIVRFGSRVTIERAHGRRQTFRIVGEDEADPREGTISYVAPLARALVAAMVDDEVAFQGDVLTIVAVDQTPDPSGSP